MTPPGKSAARRLPPYEAELARDTSDTGFEAAIRNTASARAAARAPAAPPSGSARDKLLTFPGFEPSRPTPRAEHAAAEPVAEAEFGSELEAALMNDLQSMVAQFDEIARDPAPQPAPAPLVRAPEPPRAERYKAAASDPDQEALERLLASIRQGDGAPRREALPAELVEQPVEAFKLDDLSADEPAGRDAAAPRRDPASPRPGARDARMAPPIPRIRKPAAGKPASVQAAAKPVARGRLPNLAEPVPALRLADAAARRGYLKPAIAISALIILATIGAGMTIRALTARNDTAPALAEATTPAAAPSESAIAATPAASPAKAAAEPMPQSEAPAAETPRLAVDNSLPATSAAPAPQIDAAATAPQAETRTLAARPAPRVPLEPAVTANPDPIELAAAPAASAATTATAATTNAAAADAAPADQSADAMPAKPAASIAAEKPATANASWAAGGLPAGPARIASGVKLRTNPDNGAPVIAVLAQGAAVDVVSCKGWCEIVAGDKRGFVYQKFLAKAGG